MMGRKQIIFGMMIVGSLFLLFMSGLWFGGLSKVEAQAPLPVCRSIWLASCGSGGGCTPNCSVGPVGEPGETFVSSARSDDNYRLAICASTL